MVTRRLNISPIAIAGQQQFEEIFPLVIQWDWPDADLADVLPWIEQQRHELIEKSSTHGAVLFRGFPLATAEDFDAFVAAFGLVNFPYEESLSNAVRINKTARVFTANEAPPDVTIFLHHEMAQTPIYPSRLFFFCEQPAESGGATPICRSDVLFERLSQRAAEFVRACEQKGLRYTNVMPPQADLASGMGRSWQSTLRAESREQAEQRLAGLGYCWQWLDDGCLRATTPVLPSVRQLPSGRISFFNQLIAAYQGWKDARNDPSKSITLGDGTPLDHDAATLAGQLAEELTFDIPWRRGDVALLDNFVTMHGRRSFSGTRKVLASLVA
jgi:hypothetical protein